MADTILNTAYAERAKQIQRINQEKYEMDQISQLHYAEKKGVAKGHIPFINAVRVMIKRDYQFCDIVYVLGLEEDYLQKIVDLVTKYPDLSNLDIAFKLLKLI